VNREILTNSRFYLELSLDGSDAVVDAIFTECKGFKPTQDVIEACEVTPRQWGKASRGKIVRTKLAGNDKYTNLVLKRGMTSSKTIWNWFEAVKQGNWFAQRRNGSLSIYDQEGKIQARYEFRGAWPTSYVVGDVNVGGADMAIEDMEVAIEELIRVQ
jgi:phage tail-like protein